MRISATLVFPALALASCAAAEPPPHLRIAGADANRGRVLTATYGCGTCHSIPHVRGARGVVGPPLGDYAQRTLLAGVVPNTPSTLVPFLINPATVIPGTGMPNVGLSAADARHIAAFLYSLSSGSTDVYPPAPPLDLAQRRQRAPWQAPSALGAARP